MHGIKRRLQHRKREGWETRTQVTWTIMKKSSRLFGAVQVEEGRHLQSGAIPHWSQALAARVA